MAFFKSKYFIALFSFALGMSTTWVWMKVSAFQVYLSKDRKTLQEDFGTASSPHSFFEEIRRMQEQMMGAAGPGAMSLQEMSSMNLSENDAEYLVELPIDDRMNAKDFNVQVENGMLQIEGTLQSSEEGSSMVSNFSRSFPVPEDINTDLIQIDSAQGRVVVRLPKKKK